MIISGGDSHGDSGVGGGDSGNGRGGRYTDTYIDVIWLPCKLAPCVRERHTSNWKAEVQDDLLAQTGLFNFHSLDGESVCNVHCSDMVVLSRWLVWQF